MHKLIAVGAVAEAIVAIVALVAGGSAPGGRVMALAAALIGTSIAFAAQLVAVVMLRPAMKAEMPVFARRWVGGMAVRFGSFVVLAVVMVTLREVLSPAWMAAGYLGMLLVLLFAETRFLT